MANLKSADQFLNSLSDLDLILETKAAIKKERLATAVVIRYFQEIEDRKLYLVHSCSSLFEFATQHLGYCAGSAQSRINAVRLMKSVPEVETKLESGELSLTAVSKIQSFVYQEKKARKEITISEICDVIDSCSNKSTREVERELAKRNPDVMKVEFVKPVGVDRFQLSFSISEELEGKVRKLKGLLAHSNPNMTNEELFEKLVELGLEKFDPVRKAQRVAKRKAQADIAKSVDSDVEVSFSNSARADDISDELNFENLRSAYVACKTDEPAKQSSRAGEAESAGELYRAFECGDSLHIDVGAKTSVQENPSFHASETDSIKAQQIHARETESFEYEHQFEFGFSRVMAEAERKADSIIEDRMAESRNRYIPAETRNEVWLKNFGRGCEFVSAEGHTCGSQHALQIDHVHGFARGGSHEAANLRILCAQHNRFIWKVRYAH